jgi:hypothetical protein
MKRQKEGCMKTQLNRYSLIVSITESKPKSETDAIIEALLDAGLESEVKAAFAWLDDEISMCRAMSGGLSSDDIAQGEANAALIKSGRFC